MNAVVPLQQQQISTGQRMNALVPNNIGEALQLADIMAQANLMPEHLRGKPGDCLLVVMQAQRWGMDAVSVAQSTAVVRGKLCYEGKLVAAALYAMGAIDGRLRYEFSGTGQNRCVRVTGKPRGTASEQVVEGTVADWQTNNDAWKRQPDDMLVYRGTRQWARRYAPDAMLGVYTPDEMEDTEPHRTVATVAVRTEPAIYSAAEFTKNLPNWKAVIESGRKKPEDLIAMVEAKAKARMTDEQRKQLRQCEAIEVAEEVPAQDTPNTTTDSAADPIDWDEPAAGDKA
ncbi:RecT family protein [compost metagenome]